MTTNAKRSLMGLPEPARKHRFRIAPLAANPGGLHVYFQCRRCTANISIPRVVLRALTTERGTYLFDVNLGGCLGRA